MNARFALTKDTPDSRVWTWNDYVIEWQPLPEDGSWDETWEYLLTCERLGRNGLGCGFETLEAAAEYAMQDDANCTYLETFGGCMSYFDRELNVWVTKQI